LESELSRASVSTGGSGTTATFSASLTASGVTEVGLFAAQTLVCRLTLDTPVDVSGTVTVTLETDNDASVDRGVITTTGQAVVRDILASDSPALPTEYAYGRGQSAPAETDTALDDRAATLSLGDIVVQTADTTSEFDAITPTFGSDEPIRTANGAIETLQSGFFLEAENPTSDVGLDFRSARSNASQAEYVAADDAGAFGEYEFTTAYDVPDGNGLVFLRLQTEATDTPGFEVSVDSNVVATIDKDGLSDALVDEWGWTANLGPFSTSAGSHTVRVELTSESANKSELYIDAIFVGDDRFSDAILSNTTDSNDNLSSPALFTDVQEVAFDAASTRRTINSVTATEAFNDVSNNQFITVSNDGGTTTQRFDNTSEATGNFATGGTAPQVTIGLSRFGSRTTASPSQGFRGQTVSQHELVAGAEGITPSDIGAANVRAIARTGDLSAESDNLTEGGQRDASGNLLSRSIFPAFPIGSQTRVESSEETTFTQE
jgi:hypothetical protein